MLFVIVPNASNWLLISCHIGLMKGSEEQTLNAKAICNIHYGSCS